MSGEVGECDEGWDGWTWFGDGALSGRDEVDELRGEIQRGRTMAKTTTVEVYELKRLERHIRSAEIPLPRIWLVAGGSGMESLVLGFYAFAYAAYLSMLLGVANTSDYCGQDAKFMADG